MGGNETSTLTMMKTRFAGKEAAVEQAFTTSESFRGLCRDYLACVGALARWGRSESEDAARRSAEYAELVTELTRELEEHLGTPRRIESVGTIEGDE